MSDDERTALETLDDHAEFDDWISVGCVPESLRTHDAITVSTLTDLVDAAIDNDCRVIYDAEDGSYHVLDDTVRYQYTSPMSVADARAVVTQRPSAGIETDADEQGDTSPDGELADEDVVVPDGAEATDAND